MSTPAMTKQTAVYRQEPDADSEVRGCLLFVMVRGVPSNPGNHVVLDKRTWELMGSPSEITVTIEPGFTVGQLNQ